jgi:hypothetical protein
MYVIKIVLRGLSNTYAKAAGILANAKFEKWTAYDDESSNVR